MIEAPAAQRFDHAGLGEYRFVVALIRIYDDKDNSNRIAVIEANGFRFYTQSPFGRSALFAGAGVKGGHVFGVTDEKGDRVIKSEWNEKRSIYPEDVIATIYSQLGIDWTKKITNTPSGRAFEYIEQQS